MNYIDIFCFIISLILLVDGKIIICYYNNYGQIILYFLIVILIHYCFIIVNYTILILYRRDIIKRKSEFHNLIWDCKTIISILLIPLKEEIIFRSHIVYPNSIIHCVYIIFIFNECLFNKKFKYLSTSYKIVMIGLIFINFISYYLPFMNIIVNGLTFGVLHFYNHINLDLLSLYLCLICQGFAGIIMSFIAIEYGLVYAILYHYIYDLILVIPFIFIRYLLRK